MPDVTLLCSKIEEGINRLQERISAKEWRRYSRVSFLHNLRSTVEELEGIASMLEMLASEFRRQGISDSADMDGHLKEINSVIVVLRRNQKMEEERSARGGGQGLEALAEGGGSAELYSSLEQKVLGLLLKTRYLVERVSILSARERSAPVQGRSAHRNVLELLERKEEELQRLKEQYEELRNRSFLGFGEQTAPDLEHELNEIARRLEAEGALLGAALKQQSAQIENLANAQSELGHKMGVFEEMGARHAAKASELATMLKKERDYAKKIVLDIEHETLQLRNTYSRELLALEETKARAREEIKEKARGRVEQLEHELGENKNLLEQFRKIAHEKEEKIQKLGEILSARAEGKVGRKEKKRRAKKKGK